ncbi:FK506-binding protein 2 [Dendrobium catenatum]|uniref:peptidylprolyl isomerase n=1 Tax=Dendrobium catenatum TaxID=906689 RepID=A0A2I0XEH3_9ASPA|nr:FK506-binding protein 2 [Dendrobium catenatum]
MSSTASLLKPSVRLKSPHFWGDYSVGTPDGRTVRFCARVPSGTEYRARWDQGLLRMCIGEKRKLKIPAKLGYGAQGSPPKIPGGATLVFDTELVAVNGKTLTSDKNTEGDEDL